MSRRAAYLGCAIGVALIATALLGSFQEARAAFTRGETLNHHLSVCLSRASAVEIVQTHALKGYAAANDLWQEKHDCGTVPVVNLRVGKVIFSLEVEKEEGKRVTSKVVEIINGSDEVIGYFITREPVSPGKKERDS